jgi:hypothetical protein
MNAYQASRKICVWTTQKTRTSLIKTLVDFLSFQMNCSMEPLYLNGQYFHLQVSSMENPNIRRTELRFSGPEMEYEMVSVPYLVYNLSNLKIGNSAVSYIFIQSTLLTNV